eukprot:360637-Chlamydomonas_euryale.AAC.6
MRPLAAVPLPHLRSPSQPPSEARWDTTSAPPAGAPLGWGQRRLQAAGAWHAAQWPPAAPGSAATCSCAAGAARVAARTWTVAMQPMRLGPLRGATWRGSSAGSCRGACRRATPPPRAQEAGGRGMTQRRRRRRRRMASHGRARLRCMARCARRHPRHG